MRIERNIVRGIELTWSVAFFFIEFYIQTADGNACFLRHPLKGSALPPRRGSCAGHFVSRAFYMAPCSVAQLCKLMGRMVPVWPMAVALTSRSRHSSYTEREWRKWGGGGGSKTGVQSASCVHEPTFKESLPPRLLQPAL